MGALVLKQHHHVLATKSPTLSLGQAYQWAFLAFCMFKDRYIYIHEAKNKPQGVKLQRSDIWMYIYINIHDIYF